MLKFALIIFIFLLKSHISYSTDSPLDGASLNYRIIGFKFSPVTVNHGGEFTLIKKYKIEVAAGNFTIEDSFKRNIIKTLNIKDCKVIVEVPYFGCQYTWRYSYSNNGSRVYSKFYHFATTYVSVIDSTRFRLRVTQLPAEYEDHYVFLDENRTLYDMYGNAVWHLPNIQNLIEDVNVPGGWINDLKLSSHNTITFLYNDQAYEINYEGEILWKGPNNGSVGGDELEHYHHEFTRLKNGHYMVLGRQYNWEFPSPKDSIPDPEIKKGKKGFQAVDFGTIIEYNEKGDVVWSWKPSKFFLNEAPDFQKPIKRYIADKEIDFDLNKFDFSHPNIGTLQKDVHENSFFFDESNKVVYLSFKNISFIIKIKYPEGNILNTYGPSQKQENNEIGGNLFCHQHSCQLSKEGNLLLFNNNMCNLAPPKISVFKEQSNGELGLTKIWEYQCPVEIDSIRKFNHGGNVLELSDGSMFINMGSEYSRVLITNREKKILWSGFPERWNLALHKWENLHQYRASIITRRQLEDLIWNSCNKGQK